MPRLIPTMFFAAFCACVLLLAPGISNADHHLEKSAAVVAAADQAAPGCPYSEGGNCCATCQDRAAQAAAPAEEVKADCPCKQRAKLREKAAAEAAK